MPQTPPEELKQFNRLFSFAARQEMSDQHLWFSLLSRPTRSSFTRIQRWGCCVSLLFTSMIASAMWFGRLDEEEEKGQLIRLGPFVWSTKQFFIATMTAVIVFPVNLIIIQLFRKSKPPPSDEKVSPSFVHIAFQLHLHYNYIKHNLIIVNTCMAKRETYIS